MKRSYIIHGAWAFVALAAFGLGGFGKSRTPSGASGEARQNDPIPPRLTALSGDRFDSTQASPSALPAGPTLTIDGDPTVALGLSARRIESLSGEAFSDPNPLKRSLAFSKLLEGLTADNVELVMQSMKDGKASREQWQLFTYGWGSVDGAGAMDYALNELEGDRRSHFQGQVLSGWAGASPSAAIAWVEGIEDPEARNRFNGSLISGLADHDIGMATDYTYQLAAEGNRSAAGYLDSIAQEEMRKSGVDGAIVWAERLPDGELKGSALDRVASTYVHRDPEAAARWAAQFANRDWGVRVIEEIGDEWAERDPAASVAWLETLPDGGGRNEGTYSAFREWAQRDAMTASQHLVDMPNSAAKDHAVRGLARTIASRDPESAVVWADTITEPGMRTETLTRTAQEWYRRDRAAATAWLESSSLSPEARKQITNPPQQRDRRRRG